MKKALTRPFSTLLAGLLASLPLILTVVLITWVVQLLKDYLGPHSRVGDLLAFIGLRIVRDDEWKAYLLGVLIFVAVIYLLGVLVQTKLRHYLTALVDRTVKRIPLIGALYDTTDRFIGMFDRNAKSELAAMRPVWCFFGGAPGTAVLALMPNPQPVRLGDKDYLTILVPTAPVPIGGGLLYVPAEWVKPAEVGVEQLTSIYLSMGITPPPAQKLAP